MNCCDANGNCRQGRDCPVRGYWKNPPETKISVVIAEDEQPTPADGQLVWVVAAFIVLMLGLLTLRSCL
jgi:hypothetical protein